MIKYLLCDFLNPHKHHLHPHKNTSSRNRKALVDPELLKKRSICVSQCGPYFLTCTTTIAPLGELVSKVACCSESPDHDLISMRQPLPRARRSCTHMSSLLCVVFCLSRYISQTLPKAQRKNNTVAAKKKKSRTLYSGQNDPKPAGRMAMSLGVTDSVIPRVPLQHPVLDGLEQRGSQDREFDGGRPGPKGGGVRRNRSAERSHVRLFLGTGVLGRRR